MYITGKKNLNVKMSFLKFFFLKNTFLILKVSYLQKFMFCASMPEVKVAHYQILKMSATFCSTAVCNYSTKSHIGILSAGMNNDAKKLKMIEFTLPLK